MKYISSPHHPIIKHFKKLRDDKPYRKKQKTVVIEGMKMVDEVCPYHATKTLIVSHEGLAPSNIRADETYFVPLDLIRKISGVQTPEGILAEVYLPKRGEVNKASHLLVLDAISDPGNLGTLIRSSLALGWDGVYLLNNCCDPYNEKALRAAKGATFRIPLIYGSLDELKNTIKEHQFLPLAADIDGKDFHQFTDLSKKMLIMGSESHGVCQELLKISEKICIPMPGQMESLNVSVAGGILMYQLKKR